MTSHPTRQVIIDPTGAERRTSPRMPLAFPARLTCVYDTFDCELVDLSAVGALVKLVQPLPVGVCAYLRAGPFEIFATSARTASCANTSSLAGVMFESRLAQDQITILRTYARDWKFIEERNAYRAARDWWNAGIRSHDSRAASRKPDPLSRQFTVDKVIQIIF